MAQGRIKGPSVLQLRGSKEVLGQHPALGTVLPVTPGSPHRSLGDSAACDTWVTPQIPGDSAACDTGVTRHAPGGQRCL